MSSRLHPFDVSNSKQRPGNHPADRSKRDISSQLFTSDERCVTIHLLVDGTAIPHFRFVNLLAVNLSKGQTDLSRVLGLYDVTDEGLTQLAPDGQHIHDGKVALQRQWDELDKRSILTLEDNSLHLLFVK